jgi:hypothetical protein
MKGSYNFKVKSKKTLFEFTVKRNITIIKGDSASGKTTLLHMLYEYLRVGKENYFVLVTRSPLKMLPYSVHEIYKIITSGKHTDVRESYHELSELYSNYPDVTNNKMNYVLSEDSNSGYQFFCKLFDKSEVISANGNGNIIYEIQKIGSGDILVIVDGAAFGAQIENCLEFFESMNTQRVSIWWPESFEFLILSSGLFETESLNKVLKNPSDFVECREYESWEQFFTALLISITKETMYPYSKQRLDEWYCQPKNMRKIVERFPDVLQEYSKI